MAEKPTPPKKPDLSTSAVLPKSTVERKARVAEQLRANLMKRKAQSRSRRTGEADSRPDGLQVAKKRDDE